MDAVIDGVAVLIDLDETAGETANMGMNMTIQTCFGRRLAATIAAQLGGNFAGGQAGCISKLSGGVPLTGSGQCSANVMQSINLDLMIFPCGGSGGGSLLGDSLGGGLGGLGEDSGRGLTTTIFNIIFIPFFLGLFCSLVCKLIISNIPKKSINIFYKFRRITSKLYKHASRWDCPPGRLLFILPFSSCDGFYQYRPFTSIDPV